jgi:hypothetical protein
LRDRVHGEMSILIPAKPRYSSTRPNLPRGDDGRRKASNARPGRGLQSTKTTWAAPQRLMGCGAAVFPLAPVVTDGWRPQDATGVRWESQQGGRAGNGQWMGGFLRWLEVRGSVTVWPERESSLFVTRGGCSNCAQVQVSQPVTPSQEVLQVGWGYQAELGLDQLR